MGDQPLIRSATPEDTEAAADLAVLAWTPIYEHRRQLLGDAMYRAEWPEGAEVKREQVTRMFQDHTDLCLVTELDGRIVGFATWWFDRQKGFAEIGNNAVHPDVQGRGIGTMQCERVMAIFREEGVKYARVETGLDEMHTPARRQYEKVGFTVQVPSVMYFTSLE